MTIVENPSVKEKTLQFTTEYWKDKGITVLKNHYLLSWEKSQFNLHIWFPEVNNVKQDDLVSGKQWTLTQLRVFLTVASIPFKEKVHFKNFCTLTVNARFTNDHTMGKPKTCSCSILILALSFLDFGAMCSCT